MLLSFPRSLITNSANAAWIQLIYCTIAVVLFFLTISRLYHGNRNILEIAHICGGKGLKIITGIAVFLLLGMNLVNISRECSEIIKAVLLKNVNDRIVILLFGIVCSICAVLGIEALGRVHFLFMPIAAAVLIIFLLLLIPYYRLENAAPLLGAGLSKIFGSGLSGLSLFSDLLLLNILIPNTQNLSTAASCTLKALIISGVLSVIIMLAFCLSYPYPSSQNFINPVYQLSRMIHLSGFFSRFEAFFEFTWTILLFLYASVYLFTMSQCLCQAFSLRYSRSVVPAVAIIAFAPVMLPSDRFEAFDLQKYCDNYAFIPAFIILLIFAIISRYIAKNKHKTGGKS